MNKPLNLVFSSFSTQLTDVRVAQPNYALKMRGTNLLYVERAFKAMKNEVEGAPKIIVAQRMLANPNSWPQTLRAILERGWLLVSEIDDYPITPVAVNRKRWDSSMGWRGYAACHAVQTSTDTLADVFRQYNPEVAVFANQLMALPPHATPDAKKVRIFFGAINRREAWGPLVDTINQVLSRHPEVQPIVLHDESFFDALQSDDKHFKKAVPYTDYMQYLAGCDIALLPLHDDEFTRKKSDIKFVEAAGARAAVIASPTVYADTIKHGQTGLIANTPAEWEAALERLITDKSERSRLAHNAFSYVVQNRMLMDHIDARIDWYHDLWARREELTAKLIERFPECAP